METSLLPDLEELTLFSMAMYSEIRPTNVLMFHKITILRQTIVPAPSEGDITESKGKEKAKMNDRVAAGRKQRQKCDGHSHSGQRTESFLDSQSSPLHCSLNPHPEGNLLSRKPDSH